MKFHDRTHAAFLLAEELKKYTEANAIVLAIPNGGVPMGYALAHQLALPLDIIMVKKIGHPLNPEYAIGSVSLTEVIVTDTRDVSREYIQQEADRVRKNLKVKYDLFMNGRSPISLKGKIVFLVDDGIATGNTLLACIEQLRKSKPKKIVIAVPVASDSACARIKSEADEFICLYYTSDFYSVSQFYDKFDQVSDTAVVEWIKKSNLVPN
jgi:putative phosphoribosyl transferase